MSERATRLVFPWQVFKDVVFGMAPIGRREALNMIESIKSIELLKGVRGERPSDLKAIANNLQRLSQLVTDFPEIEEFDINPLMVLEEGKGAFTVDVRVGEEVAVYHKHHV